MANVAAQAKTESYEIATYTALVRMAKDQGEREIARLLQENLDQEKEMAKRVEAVAKALGDEAKAAVKEEEQARKAEEKRARDEERERGGDR
jgi:ferritin-like metal-binding protein YciE